MFCADPDCAGDVDFFVTSFPADGEDIVDPAGATDDPSAPPCRLARNGEVTFELTRIADGETWRQRTSEGAGSALFQALSPANTSSPRSRPAPSPILFELPHERRPCGELDGRSRPDASHPDAGHHHPRAGKPLSASIPAARGTRRSSSAAVRTARVRMSRPLRPHRAFRTSARSSRSSPLRSIRSTSFRCCAAARTSRSIPGRSSRARSERPAHPVVRRPVWRTHHRDLHSLGDGGAGARRGRRSMRWSARSTRWILSMSATAMDCRVSTSPSPAKLGRPIRSGFVVFVIPAGKRRSWRIPATSPVTTGSLSIASTLSGEEIPIPGEEHGALFSGELTTGR